MYIVKAISKCARCGRDITEKKYVNTSLEETCLIEHRKKHKLVCEGCLSGISLDGIKEDLIRMEDVPAIRGLSSKKRLEAERIRYRFYVKNKDRLELENELIELEYASGKIGKAERAYKKTVQDFMQKAFHELLLERDPRFFMMTKGMDFIRMGVAHCMAFPYIWGGMVYSMEPDPIFQAEQSLRLEDTLTARRRYRGMDRFFGQTDEAAWKDFTGRVYDRSRVRFA